MLKNILIVLLLLLVALVGIAFLLPSEVGLERQTTIDAPPSTLYALTSGYSRFNEWSPWAGKDADTIYEYSGPHHGVGARMAWKSENREVGVGSQEVIAVTPNERVETKLSFEGQGDSVAYFEFEPVDDGTLTTWGFRGDMGNNPIARWFGLFLEGMLAPDYEQGLANLKAMAEAMPNNDFADLEAEIVEVEPVRMAYISSSTSQDHEEVGAALGAAYGKVGAFMAKHGYEPAGQPLTVNKTWEDDVYEFDAGIPIAGGPDEAPQDDEVQIGSTQAGQVLRAVHTGPYGNLETTYYQLEAYLAAYGYEATGAPWDVWVNDPESTPEAELITHIHYPIAAKDPS